VEEIGMYEVKGKVLYVDCLGGTIYTFANDLCTLRAENKEDLDVVGIFNDTPIYVKKDTTVYDITRYYMRGRNE
jgi:hypothetical protein